MNGTSRKESSCSLSAGFDNSRLSRPDSMVIIRKGSRMEIESGINDFVSVSYFMLGAGFLLPWNAFITAADYFEYIYPNMQISRKFSVAYLLTCLSGLLLLISFGKNVSARKRINFGLLLFFVGIVAIPFMDVVFLHREQGSKWTFAVTLCVVVMAGAGDALVRGTLIMSASLGSKGGYMQAIVSGTGFSGVIVCMLRIATKASFSTTKSGLRASANIYFIVGAAFLVVCFVLYNIVHNLTVQMTYYDEEEDVKSAANGGLTDPLLSDSSTESDEEDDDAIPFYDPDNKEERKTLPGRHVTISALQLPLLLVSSPEDDSYQKSDVRRALHDLKWLVAAIALVNMTNLTIFPGFLTEDVSSAVLNDWYPVLLLSSFNLGDFLGKCIPPIFMPSKQKPVISLALVRVLLIPLFALCAHGPQIFSSEPPVFILTGLLGVSGGISTASTFVLAPKTVTYVADAETSGFLMVMGLEVGLSLGSLISWSWVM